MRRLLPEKITGTVYPWLLAHVSHQGRACLPWPFAKDLRTGRGSMRVGNQSYWAHRVMCVLAHGEPPTPKHQAAHECGKGHYGCVNPRHLAWKTNSQNQLDRRKNGNMLRNNYGPKSRLEASKIAQIVNLRGKKTQVEIAKIFGVSLGCVQYWQHERERRKAA